MWRSDSNTFKVTSGSLFASDPCYETDTWCAGKLENVKNGEWQFEVVEKEGRIAELWVFTESSATGWEPVDKSFGVDSGQFGFFDYDYFKEHETERDYGGPGFYTEACNQTYNEKASYNNPDWVNAGIVGEHGAVSSSGWGDGSYDVYVQKNAYGEIVAAKAVFMTDEEEEEEYDEEYDEEYYEFNDE